MAKTAKVVANVVGQVAAMLVSPLFDGGGVKEKYFEGYRAIQDIFPDEVLADLIADELNKKVDQDILCEELYLLRGLLFKGSKKEQIKDFSGLEYLGNLEVIRMSHLSELESVPKVLQDLPNLKVVEFSHGKLTEIPSWLFKNSRLEKLNFSHQEIDVLPRSMHRAKRLRILNVSSNEIIFLPQEIGSLKHLQVLNLSDNPLLRLPIDIIYLTKLHKLDISHTLVSHLPINLALLEDLDYLNIEDTNIKNVDFLLQRRTRDNLQLYSDTGEIKVTTYAKHDYEDDRHLFPGTVLSAAAIGMLALGVGTRYLKNKNKNKLKGDMN